MLGLESAKVRELWDVLSSAQNNMIYGRLVDLYPERPSCKDPTTMTKNPMYNISIAYTKAGYTTPTEAKELTDKAIIHQAAWVRLLMARVGTVVGTSAVKTALNDLTDAQIEKAAKEYVKIEPIEAASGGYRVTYRIPAEWFETISLDQGVLSQLGFSSDPDSKVSGPSVIQTAMTSLALRKPSQSEIKPIEGKWTRTCSPKWPASPPPTTSLPFCPSTSWPPK